MPRVWLWSYFDFHHTEIISGPWACPHYIGPLMSCSPLLSSPDQARKSDQMTPVRPAALPPLLFAYIYNEVTVEIIPAGCCSFFSLL